MTAEKLYGVLKFLDGLDSRLGLQTSLEAIGTALSNVASAPAQPQHQSSLASALASFEDAVSKMKASLSPSRLAVIKAMGGEEFFDPLIADKIRTSVQTNAMTPTVARDFVQDLVSRRSKFLSTVRSARQSLEALKVQESQLESGTADIAFMIPRDIFDNQLGSFAKELKFIDRLIGHFSEATGAAQPATLEQLSSSDPTVALLAAVPVVLLIGTVANKFLDAWEKTLKIRKLRTELADMGLKGEALNELDDRITTTVDEVVEESAVLVMASYKGDAGRKEELNNAVRQDARRLFGQIERGLTVEFRAKGGDSVGENQNALEAINNIAREIKFPEYTSEPMLLGNGEVLEGDLVVKQSKKTTTRKTTVSKKAGKDGDEPKE